MHDSIKKPYSTPFGGTEAINILLNVADEVRGLLQQIEMHKINEKQLKYKISQYEKLSGVKMQDLPK